MHRGLVALSASAIAAIYIGGYLHTQSADASISADALPTATVAPIAAAAPTAAPPPIIQRQSPPTARTAPAPPAQPTAALAAAPPASSSGATQQTQGAYKDGTYTGTGTSRRGDLSVSVDVQGGRISNVTITKSSLQYPLRDIANLPGEVVQRQSAQVDVVSRATYSSQAFRGAVTQALSSAKA
jgi:uncharacterized protein with FMN-binding domain